MAKTRETTAPDPPVESEEEESGDEVSEEENQGSESESEPESPSPNAKKPSSAPTPAPAPAPAPASKKPESQTTKPQTPDPDSSSSEEESGSDTDTDSPPKKADPSIKPIASKPMNVPEKPPATKKPRSKSNASSGPASPTRAGAKRPATVAATPATDADADADTKRSKRKLVETSEKKGVANDEGKKLFVRVWSEDDEIAILKGMIDYSAKKKADPVTDLNAFHEFIRSKINIDVSRTQLQDKIRRLRKKYENNAGKEKNGKERTFSNPHEQKAYDVSKKIWGTKKTVGEEALDSPKANGTAVRKSRSKGAVGTTQNIEVAEVEVKEEKSLVSENKKSVSFVLEGKPIDGWIFTDGMKFMEEYDRVEMEEKWRLFRKEEAGLFVKRMELSLEHAKKVFNAL